MYICMYTIIDANSELKNIFYLKDQKLNPSFIIKCKLYKKSKFTSNDILYKNCSFTICTYVNWNDERYRHREIIVNRNNEFPNQINAWEQFYFVTVA